jgi:hypothetical protein
MEIDSPSACILSPRSRRRCEAFDDVENTPLWMQYMVPLESSIPMVPGECDNLIDTHGHSDVSRGETVSNSDKNYDFEQKPLWMRCLPNNKIIPKSATSSVIETATSSSDMMNSRRKVSIKKSSNSFGPTSSHAVTVENVIIQAAKRKRRNTETEEMKTVDEAQQVEEIEEEMSKRKYLRSTRQRTVNVCEAAELFSIVNLK